MHKRAKLHFVDVFLLPVVSGDTDTYMGRLQAEIKLPVSSFFLHLRVDILYLYLHLCLKLFVSQSQGPWVVHGVGTTVRTRRRARCSP